ncbi:hypothetical protein A2361_01710 [Candidatus Woesebacteria bacterium RIFOXYB1_FULL_40_26]|uniref:Peptidase M50 domain-containing protein n=1 Tax=Candidatus Woesebacteria bacterium RIFOXYB1_FULL_40_26 TaxID=1802539 RepID=A0A1F8CVE9_9BACT|nr:MAG: hypothetical protein A2361_01710 [Candidatus Woesebacteria bacterium RIFOXYB1_FULL_40_26]
MSILSSIVAFAVAITIHEAAHAWMADRLGDPTARLAGRLSLNPLAHVDIYGTILIPLILIFLGSPFVFGWAKPVVFDPYNLKNPRSDSALISLAGPLSNLILATFFSLVLRIYSLPFSPLAVFSGLIYPLIIINVALAVFNLIPIHPLDGGKILVGLLPPETARKIDLFLNRYGLMLLLFLIFPVFNGRSALSLYLYPVVSFVLSILIPGNPII